MSSHLKRVLLPLTIGLIGFSLAMAITRWRGPLTLRAQVGASDFLFVRAGGPRFGARPVDKDIVLVLFDFKSAQKIGYVHSYPNDVALYQNLINAGAHVVFDTRMLAVADESTMEEIRPLLEGMRTINADGRVTRDVWLSSDLLADTEGRYNLLTAQNIVNSHPHVLPSVESRLYPLVAFLSTGPVETAPLAIARRVKNLPPATTVEVGAELRRSGVMSLWHKHAPDLVPKTEVVQSPYRLGQQQIEWHPFESTTSLVPPAAFWVSYDPPIAEYRRHSYVDVLKRADAQDFKGKCVIVGYAVDVDPTSDTYEAPSLDGKASAAELVACATQTLLDDHQMAVMPTRLGIAAAAVLTIALALTAGLMRPLHAVAAALLLLLGYYSFAVASYRVGWYPDCVIIPAVGAATAVAGGVSNAWLNLRMRRRVLDLFGRYVPRAVVNQLMLRPELESLTLGGTVREVTVLFADIRGFTTFSQHLPPEEIVLQLNSLLQVMVACTFENEGTLDKFIGDAILVLFNAPLDQTDHTERAVRTAAKLQQELAGHPSGLSVGVGVHRGAAVVGNIGTPQRMEYTAIGSTVNIASRLCDFAKPGEVVVSQQVLEQLAEGHRFESLGAVQVKGISESLLLSRLCKQQ